MNWKSLMVAGFALATTMVAANAAEITGAGATFPAPIYLKWADAYKAETGTTVNYQAVGSGAGIKMIQSKTVIFGASDMPLKIADLTKDGLVQWPMVIGGIVPIVNLDDVKSGQLVIDGPTLAQIYMGKITRWNDAKLVALNPKVKLPDQPIVVVRRSDGSGTTYNFTNFLSKASPEWNGAIGAGSTVEFPVGIGAKGNDGVANNVKMTKNAIGYVEYAFAVQNDLIYTDMINVDGKRVSPKIASFRAAAANAQWSSEDGFYRILTNQPGVDSWPITAATFIIMYQKPEDKAMSAEAIKFFQWAFNKGSKMAEDLDYIPLPKSLVDQIGGVWKTVENK